MKSTLAFCMLIGALTIPTGRAYGQTRPDATIQALLDEVRQLRLTLERSSVVAPKIHLTLQRMQLQQDQVARLSRQLDEVRDQVARSVAEEANIAARLKVSEAHVAEEQDASRRKQVESEIKGLKAHLEQVSERQRMQDSQQRAREIDLARRLQTEQFKLNELNDHLNALERALDAPPKQP